jgi:hypothetical protein
MRALLLVSAAVLAVVLVLGAALASSRNGILISSELLTGRSRLSVIQCTYLTGVRSMTLRFVNSPEAVARCPVWRARADLVGV